MEALNVTRLVVRGFTHDMESITTKIFSREARLELKMKETENSMLYHAIYVDDGLIGSQYELLAVLIQFIFYTNFSKKPLRETSLSQTIIKSPTFIGCALMHHFSRPINVL